MANFLRNLEKESKGALSTLNSLSPTLSSLEKGEKEKEKKNKLSQVIEETDKLIEDLGIPNDSPEAKALRFSASTKGSLSISDFKTAREVFKNRQTEKEEKTQKAILEAKKAGVKLTGEETLSEIGKLTTEAENRSKIDKEVASQAQKSSAKLAPAVGQLLSVGQTSLDQFLSFGKEQFRIFKTKTGDFLGLLDKMTPAQVNEFKGSFNSAKNEAAALVGRTLIPSARAVSMIKIFESSTAKVGDTIEGGSRNVAETARNAIGSALHNNIRIEQQDGSFQPILNTVKDPKTGVIIGSIPDFFDRSEAITRFARDFEKKTNDVFLDRVFKEAPELLQAKTLKRLRKKSKEITLPSGAKLTLGG